MLILSHIGYGYFYATIAELSSTLNSCLAHCKMQWHSYKSTATRATHIAILQLLILFLLPVYAHLIKTRKESQTSNVMLL